MTQSDLQAKIDRFFSQFHSSTYEKGTLILQPEDAPTGACYLQTGHVREYGFSPQGTEVTLHIFNPHSYFPMMCVLADIPNRYYYEALDDVKVFTAPKEKVLSFLNENPDVLMDLTKRVFMGLDKLTARIEHLAYGKAKDKVISILLYLARHFGEKKDSKVFVKYKFTHRDIGALAGISRETTSREWEKLVKEGLISYDQQYIVINDVDKLRQKLT